MITIIFPFYNEEIRIDRFIFGLKNYKNRNNLITNIILVNDGSTDNTLEILKVIRHETIEIRVINIIKNQGKGNALKAGMKEVTTEWVLCNDADLSYSFEQIDDWFENKFIDLRKQEIVYFGRRVLNDKESKFHLHRIVIGKLFYLFIRLILGINIGDTQCGFKFYRTEIAKIVFRELNEKRFAFDIEIIYRLKKMNCTIQLNPVTCIDVEDSKVNLLTDSMNMLMALFRIRKY